MRKLKYDEVDFYHIDLNPHLVFICNGDKKEIEVIKDDENI